jgi:hypothetical protein
MGALGMVGVPHRDLLRRSSRPSAKQCGEESKSFHPPS